MVRAKNKDDNQRNGLMSRTERMVKHDSSVMDYRRMRGNKSNTEHDAVSDGTERHGSKRQCLWRVREVAEADGQGVRQADARRI